MTQHEVNRMENRMVVDRAWWAQELHTEEEEDDHIVMICSDGTIVYEDGWEPEVLDDEDEF